ncbi:MAG: hypothetical protein M1301_03255, partial [Candidatus Thermoplasmatota archaeon]|nr:hypothetical protein [Candidatus Thermoplasmatota archaeon]
LARGVAIDFEFVNVKEKIPARITIVIATRELTFISLSCLLFYFYINFIEVTNGMLDTYLWLRKQFQYR